MSTPPPRNAMGTRMLLIPGRSSKQGTALNKGKLEAEYRQVVSTVEMHPDDMRELGVDEGGTVRLSTPAASVEVTARAARPDDLPRGVLFIPYGPPSSALMEADTAASGMPLSKHLEVTVEPA